MMPVLTETVTSCAICGEVACERDLLYVDTASEAEDLDVSVGDIVCRACAGEPHDQ